MDIPGACVKCHGRLALRAALAERAESPAPDGNLRPSATVRNRVPEIYCVVCETPQEEHPALKDPAVQAEINPPARPEPRPSVAPLDYAATVPDRVATLERQVAQLLAGQRREAGRRAS